MKPLPCLPPDCLLSIVRLAASPEPGAAADPGAYLRQLLSVGGVCRHWRTATLAAPFDADISWAQLRRFVAQVLATDARATALRRLAVSGAPLLAREVEGAVGVFGFANLGRQQGVDAQQEVYRALWRDWGLQRIHGTLTELSLQCGKPPRGDYDVTPSILLRSLRMEILREDTQPWPRLERLSISCPSVHEKIGGELVRCFPTLRSLEWAELLATEQAWGALAAAPNLHTQLTRLCLGVGFEGDPWDRRHSPIFRLSSLAPLAQLQELEVAYNDPSGIQTLRFLDPPAGQWLPPALRHLRLAGGAVLLPSTAGQRGQPRLRPLQFGGLEATLQSLVLVADSTSALPAHSFLWGAPENLLGALPAMPALRALGLVPPGGSTRPSLRIADLHSKLPALTHLFIPAHPVDEPTIGTKYRLVLEPQPGQPLPSQLAALAARNIRIFLVDYND